ncbi:MAG: protease complex subunit PrcB family protein [Thermoanaerobaculia bacterium]
MFFRRSFAVLFTLLLAIPVLGGGSPSPKSWRLLKKGTDGVPARAGGEGGRRRAPWIELAADQASFEELWKREVPGRPGDVDFENETAIFLLLGVQSTGGYAIEPISVEPPKDGVVRVHARLVQPMDDSMVTEAITAPFAVIAVQARELIKVEWVNDDGRLLATRIVE